MAKSPKKWDVFVSHASEDKDSFVRPLALALQALGISVWYDEFSLRLGESLSRSIDRGLAQSEFGLVIISPHFIEKHWPEYELRGLVAREVREDRVILPIWHGVTRDQVLDFSPPLADKVALDTAGLSAQDIAIKLLREIRPDLYSKHPRTELKHLASGMAIQELQAELDAAREELSEYRCPYCNSPLAVRIDAPTDPNERDWDTREVFECGFRRFAGFTERPCPADPQFPAFADFEVRFSHEPAESYWKWSCYAVGKTPMAKMLGLERALGRTKEEALQKLKEQYHRYAKRNT